MLRSRLVTRSGEKLNANKIVIGKYEDARIILKRTLQE